MYHITLGHSRHVYVWSGLPGLPVINGQRSEITFWIFISSCSEQTLEESFPRALIRTGALLDKAPLSGILKRGAGSAPAEAERLGQPPPSFHQGSSGTQAFDLWGLSSLSSLGSPEGQRGELGGGSHCHQQWQCQGSLRSIPRVRHKRLLRFELLEPSTRATLP